MTPLEILMALLVGCAVVLALVPLAMYFVRGLVKLEIGVATGKKQHDKRQDLKKRDAQNEMRRALARKQL